MAAEPAALGATPVVFELRRRGMRARRFELRGPVLIDAQASLRSLPARGQVRLGPGPPVVELDGVTLRVGRAPRFGPWQLRDDDDEVRASLRKPRSLRERVELHAGAYTLTVRRISRFGRRVLAIQQAADPVAVGDPAQGVTLGSPTAVHEVGQVRQRRHDGSVYHLVVPADLPLEGVGLLGWWLALLTRQTRTLVPSR